MPTNGEAKLAGAALSRGALGPGFQFQLRRRVPPRRVPLPREGEVLRRGVVLRRMVEPREPPELRRVTAAWCRATTDG